jgi:hypothetical protein
MNKSGKELVKEFEVMASEDALEHELHLLALCFLSKKLVIFTQYVVCFALTNKRICEHKNDSDY